MKEIILTSSILILLLAIFRQAVRGRIAPRVQYALWLLVAARLLIPGTLFTAPVSVMGAAEDLRTSIREAYPDHGGETSPPPAAHPAVRYAQPSPPQRPPPLPPLGVLYQLTGVAGMPCVGDQKVAVVHHVAVGPDDSQLSRNSLHPRRIKGAVKAAGRLFRPFRRVVGPQADQPHVRAARLGPLHRACRQRVKTAVAPHNKLPHAILRDMPLHQGVQLRGQTVRRVPVADKKTGFLHRMTSLCPPVRRTVGFLILWLPYYIIILP